MYCQIWFGRDDFFFHIITFILLQYDLRFGTLTGNHAMWCSRLFARKMSTGPDRVAGELPNRARPHNLVVGLCS